MAPRWGHFSNTVVTLLCEVHSTEWFCFFCTLLSKSVQTRNHLQSKAKKETKRFVLSHLFGHFCVCSSMSSLLFVSSTAKHTTDIQVKAEAQARTLCVVFLLFCFCCCCLRFQVFFGYYYTWLIGLEMLLLLSHRSACSSFLRCRTNIYANPFMTLTTH